MLLPHRFWQWRGRRLLRGWEQRPDADYIRRRRDIYCRLEQPCTLGAEAREIREINTRNFQSRYALDAMRTLKYFPKYAKVRFCDGDVWHNPEVPSLIKCRRLDGKGEENAVILNLDSIRHWLNPKDKIPFEKKIPKLFFRGDIHNKPARIRFFEQWGDHPLFDLGDTTRSRWHAELVTVPEHFRYRFILALEGYDMASSLQWIMASGCVPVMPKPTAEGWLMHSQLEAGKHYIEIASDFSDAGEKIEYYTAHPEEARRIAEASAEWVRGFNDRKRERIIELLTIEKYLYLMIND